MNRLSLSCFGGLLLLTSATLMADALPRGLVLIGLTDSWKVMLEQEGQLKPINGIRHPRSASYNPVNDIVVFVGSDNVLYRYDLNTQTVLPLFDKAETQSESGARYTQPYFTSDGRWLYLVEMPDGKSRRTDIVAVFTKTGKKHYQVRKRTAQFEPFTRDANDLFYSTASCVDDCEGMIWEIWQRENDTARQYQLTLLNHVSNQPHLSTDNWLYFSSNAPDRHYHIWRMRPEPGSSAHQLTFGAHRDSEPVTDKHGQLYFIRKTRSDTSLMRLEGNEAVVVKLPEDIVDIRNLEIRQ